MAGCVDTLHVDSRGSGRWVSARRSDRVAVPVRVERDQSTRGRRSSQGFRKNSDESSQNGGNWRKCSGSDMELASVVRVEVSDDDIRAIAEDSIVPTDGQKIQDSNGERTKTKGAPKGEKGLLKLKAMATDDTSRKPFIRLPSALL